MLLCLNCSNRICQIRESNHINDCSLPTLSNFILAMDDALYIPKYIDQLCSNVKDTLSLYVM